MIRVKKLTFLFFLFFCGTALADEKGCLLHHPKEPCFFRVDVDYEGTFNNCFKCEKEAMDKMAKSLSDPTSKVVIFTEWYDGKCRENVVSKKSIFEAIDKASTEGIMEGELQ